MYEPKSPDEYNFKAIDAQNEVSESSNLLKKSQAENLSIVNIASHQNEIKRLFTRLIGIGLALGLIMGTGLVLALKKLDLATKPYERENQEKLERVEENNLNNLEGIEKQ